MVQNKSKVSITSFIDNTMRNLKDVIVIVTVIFMKMALAVPLRHICTGVHTTGAPVTPVSIPVRVGPEMWTPDEEV